MMWKVKPVPGFNFPYSVEYLVTGTILVGIGSIVVVGIVVTLLEVTVPHLTNKKGKKGGEY